MSTEAKQSTYPLNDLARQCLYQADLALKLEVTRQARQLSLENKLDFTRTTPPLPAAEVIFSSHLNWVHPRDLPRRQLSTTEGKISFLHAIAHIEFMAIHLAWDIIYRFPDMPDAFYRDWLQVADEEVLHFSLLRQRLIDLGSDYGELPVHKGLWKIAEDTADNLLARLALVPRCMEARGLDVTPGMIRKLEQTSDPASVEILTRILNDEVGHVKIGSRWFFHLCEQHKLIAEDTFFELVETYLNTRISGPFNLDLRKKAGFTESELKRLQAYS